MGLCVCGNIMCYGQCKRNVKKEEEGEKVFYAIWRQFGGGSPTVRHATFIDAATEAQRLADKTQQKFYILKVIGTVSPNIPAPPKINYTQLKDEGIDDSYKLY